MIFSNVGILIWAWINGTWELFAITILMMVAWITRFFKGDRNA